MSCFVAVAILTDDGSAGDQGQDLLPGMLIQKPTRVYACPIDMFLSILVWDAVGVPRQIPVQNKEDPAEFFWCLDLVDMGFMIGKREKSIKTSHCEFVSW